MAQIDQQISSILSVQRNNTKSSGLRSLPEEDIINEVAFVLSTKTHNTESNISNAIEEIFPKLAHHVENVFEDDDKSNSFVVTFRGASFNDLPGSPYEIAYHLKDKLFLEEAEPALETNIFEWQESDEENSNFESVESLCFESKRPSQANDLAWALRVINADKTQSEGHTGANVIIGHIDTGIADHTEVKNIDIDNGFNLYGDTVGARDPLTAGRWFDNPGHGTATSSVIVSEGGVGTIDTTLPGRITGVAPDAQLLPIRAIKSVVRVAQWRVARAIDIAVRNNAEIITMSLGGLPSFSLKKAIKHATKSNVIVMAAAGNCVRKVVYPARLKSCIAVAAINALQQPWKGSSRGKKVDFSAPGEFVWCASRRNDNQAAIAAGQGTSFAVALSAGVAAVWLQKWGRDKLIADLGNNETLQERFRYWAIKTATPMKTLPRSMGAGVIDSYQLIKTSPWSSSFTQEDSQQSVSSSLGEDALEIISEADDTDIQTQETRDIELIAASDIEDVANEIIWIGLLERHGRIQNDWTSESLPPLSSKLQARVEKIPALGRLLP